MAGPVGNWPGAGRLGVEWRDPNGSDDVSSTDNRNRRPGSLRALGLAMRSWRTASVALMAFASGLPLGLVWIAIPDWMRNSGVDIRIVGMITLAHAPWTFKMLWSPLMDRFVPPWLGRRRGWIAVTQVALFALTLCLAGVGDHPDAPWVVIALALAIAFASASQDIVIDAYAVDVLRKEELGVAGGARIAVYRAAMYVAGALAITAAAFVSWPTVNAILAVLYLPLLFVTLRAPEPEVKVPAPPSLRKAVWEPFLGFLARHRALEILAFVLFYKLADQLAQSLQRPFLVDMGYSDIDRGLALGTVGLVGTILGTFVGGALTTTLGLGHSLWIFGLLQIFSNLGFIFVSQSEPDRVLMYGAMGFETVTTGLGMGAFGVLLLRMTQQRFSATQYALFSSLFGLSRLAAGPITGFTVHSVGWTAFFWMTMLAGIPGLILLARFVPPGTRDPTFTVEPPRYRKPLSQGALALRAVAGGLVGVAFALAIMALLVALDEAGRGGRFEWTSGYLALLQPASVAGWIELLGAIVCGIVVGLLTAAVAAARHGARVDTAE
jgi:PAT family beta-lactamase induction signal transducer AmpG